tara:strand:- start:552 stop:1520 length:969 start_codon:yes stop_codon:yes gene_type:complete
MFSKILIKLNILYFIGSKLRFFIILYIVKNIIKIKRLNFIKYFFDPNIISKKINATFSENLKIIKKKNFSMMVNLNDHIGFNYFIEENFDNKIISIAKIIKFKKKDILIDVGANIGTSCIPFAKKFNCQVFAIEGSKYNAILLLRNILLNESKIHPIINIITNKKDNLKNNFTKIYLENGNMGASSTYKNWTNKKNKEVEITKNSTMDDLFEKKKINFNDVKIIKIDIEGNENKLFEGFDKIKYFNSLIIFEHRIDKIKELNQKIRLNYIEKLKKNFNLYKIIEKHNKISFQKFNLNEKCDCLAVPKKKLHFNKLIKKYVKS